MGQREGRPVGKGAELMPRSVDVVATVDGLGYLWCTECRPEAEGIEVFCDAQQDTCDSCGEPVAGRRSHSMAPSQDSKVIANS